MFGLNFLFAAALWALPLAGLPLILHLLFRQKSPIVPFSTIRFVQASLRQNAKRKKVHRWLLLACRALVMGLLIWALAQPARKLAAGLLPGGSSMAAAIVVDTSYSMLLRDGSQTLLQRADEQVRDLLGNELRDANVAIFRSAPSPGVMRFQPAQTYRGDRWATLQPTPSAGPLVDRVAAASELLNSSGADRRWLIVLSDGQAREFGRPIPAVPSVHTILIDLQPADVRAAVITGVHSEPNRPRRGIGAQIAVDLSGRPNDSREVTLEIAAMDPPAALVAPPLPMARFDNTGRAELRAPLELADSSWLTATARLSGDEALPWAAARTELVRVPPRQPVAILPVGQPNPRTIGLLRLALDPSEGGQAAWPVFVRPGAPQWNEALVVAVLNEWPDEATADQMARFVAAGGNLVLFVQPGLELEWPNLGQARQDALLRLLPSAPKAAAAQDSFHASISRPGDSVFSDVGDPHSSEGRLVITRLVRFGDGDLNTEAVINAAPNDPDSGVSLTGLLWRKPIDKGHVYTWATVPDGSCGNLHVWDLFPPTLVNAAMPSAGLSAAVNVEIGNRLILPAGKVAPGSEVDILPPDQKPVKVEAKNGSYVFGDTLAPGLYAWQLRDAGGQTRNAGWANVQLPAAEAVLRYRPMNEIAVASPDLVMGHSLEDVRHRLSDMEEPRPQWTLPIALVLLLLCLESVLGSGPRRSSAAPSRRAGTGTSHLAGAESR